MVSIVRSRSTTLTQPIEEYIHRLTTGETLLNDSPNNLLEVVGVLKSYGVVLDAYSHNLIYIAENQFLVFFPWFKYFNGEVTLAKLLRHWWHDRINFEYAEYCMKAMLWHGGGGLDTYLDSPEFKQRAESLIQAKYQGNPFVLRLHQLFPEFLPEYIRVSSYYSALGQFWRVMSDLFIALSDSYDSGEIKSIAQVVNYIKDSLVAAANLPITYAVEWRGQKYEIMPKSVGLTFLPDTAVPYVEAIFFRGTPFPGTVSYNAQARQVPPDQSRFNYGALYADPLPIGGAGIPPTLAMQDMRHHLPEYLHAVYRRRSRGEDDLLVQICESFQKSMFCVTNAAVIGLVPHPLDTKNSAEQAENRAYLKSWVERLATTRLFEVNQS